MTDIMNRFYVGVILDGGEKYITFWYGNVRPKLTRESALNLAAWLAALADENGEFEQLLKEVRET